MIRRCIRDCLRRYGRDLDVKTITIVVGCALASAVTGDFTGATFLTCLALGGVSDITVGLSTCLVKCLRGKRDGAS